jgi:putative peptidoglycan lipid II flippase
MFSVAVATVLFPSLARLATRRDLDRFRSMVTTGLRQIAFLLIPASVICAVLAVPIVRIVYQRGDFTASQTTVVSACLAAFSLGLFFNGVMLMLNRAFFSLQAAWIPTWVALGNLGLNAALDAAFYRFGIWGIPLATSFVNIAGSIVLMIMLRRHLGQLEVRSTLGSIAKIAVASAILGGIAYAVWWPLDHELGQRFVAQVVSLGLALAVGAAVYLLVCRLLRVQELRALRLLRRRGNEA